MQHLLPKAIEILRELVACDTTSAHSNLPIIELIERMLAQHGVSATRILSADGTKSNLLARIGPEVEGGIILSGHTDVVPVIGQQWDTPPFKLTERGGKLFGRGTSDMKSFAAVALACVPEFLRADLKKPIYLAFSYDEEIGCLGAPLLAKAIAANVPKPALAIIGEPTEMKVVTAHKGVFSFETTVTGVEAHSSQTDKGVNAVQIACELVVTLRALAQQLEKTGERHDGFSPPYSTVHVGIISGGTARNIIPRHCHFNWEIRPLPGESIAPIMKVFDEACAKLEAEMKNISPLASIQTQAISRMAGMEFSGEDALEKLVMHCAEANGSECVSFATEAPIFQEHGVPAIVCGPGSIDQAHKPNEFIETSQIAASLRFMERLLAFVR